MKHLNLPVRSLITESIVAEAEAHTVRLLEAKPNRLAPLHDDVLVGHLDCWVYQSMLRSMVHSGAIKVAEQRAVELLPAAWADFRLT